jgi:hypothetical protein
MFSFFLLLCNGLWLRCVRTHENPRTAFGRGDGLLFELAAPARFPYLERSRTTCPMFRKPSVYAGENEPTAVYDAALASVCQSKNL